MPIADLRPLTKMLAGNIGFVLFRLGALQATSLGVLGLVLAVVGVYGVVSYRTTQRSREIGIRMALGAVPKDVRRLVLKQGASLVVAGILVGLAVTAALTLLLTRVMLLVSATDPLTFGIVTILLSAIALVACYIPAFRAMRMQPVAALRHE
jgi:ABC-type antimicrobial peptide transport system permease subunit